MLFYKRSGSGGDTLVLLHGFGGVHDVWDGIAAAFLSTCQILAYDLPGHGGSLDFAGGLSARSAARAVLADLAARGVESAHVVGHSLGGAVATLMAVQEPDRVSSMTLLAPGGYGDWINGAVLRRFARAAEADALQGALLAMSGRDADTDAATIDALVRMRALDGQTARLVGIADAISRDDRQGSFPPEMLAGLDMPVTVLWGTDDPVLPFAQTTALPRAFELVPLEGAGHMLIEESPDAVMGALAGHLHRS